MPHCQHCSKFYVKDGKNKLKHELNCLPSNLVLSIKEDEIDYAYLDSLDSINHKRGRTNGNITSIIKKAKADNESRISCSICNKTFIDHRRLAVHINKLHSINTTILMNQNGLSFVLSDSAKNQPDTVDFLSKFNMTVCSNNNEELLSDSFMNTGFSSHKTHWLAPNPVLNHLNIL